MTSLKPINQIISESDVLINNALSDESIKTELALYGYDETKLTEGKTLLDEVIELNRKQKEEYGEQFEATEEVKSKFDTAYKAYIKAVKLSRIALKKNTKAPAALLLNGRREESISGFVEQASIFYGTMLKESEFQNEMLKYGYSTEKLQEEKQLVDDLIEANRNQEKEKGEAQSATKERNLKIDELLEWTGELREVAKIALEENEQWLEKLGILARSDEV
ncbi:MAG: hypothetical protein PVH88_22560 [Ignavibacteria bacterium]|jgi:hypothetical protein